MKVKISIRLSKEVLSQIDQYAKGAGNRSSEKLNREAKEVLEYQE